MAIRIRIGAKADRCRSVYGVFYDEDGDPFLSDATSFWTGILDGNTNIRAHTKSEVMNSYQTRVLDPGCEYQAVCNIRLDPIVTLSYYDMTRKVTTYLQKGRNKSSSPKKVLTGIPRFLTTMGIVEVLGASGDGLAQVSTVDLGKLARNIPGLPWAF